MSLQRPTKPLRPREEHQRPRPLLVTEAELKRPDVRTALKLIYNSFAWLFHDPIGMILGNAFVLFMLWGPHGKLDLLPLLWDGWRGPESDPETRAHIISACRGNRSGGDFWPGSRSS